MDFFEKNDVDTTRYVTSSLKVITLFGIMIWMLNILGIFTIQQSIMNITMSIGLCVILMPIILLKVLHLSNHSLKNLSITCLVVGIAIMNCGMTYQSLLSWTVPILLASHYYSPKTTKITFVSTAISMFIAMYIGLFWGTWDSNMMLSEEVVYGFGNIKEFIRISNESGQNTIIYVLTLFYLPRMLIMFGFYFLDVTLSKRTKNLLLLQKREYLEKENRNQELSIATQIQAAALPNVFPPFPERDEFDIYASMTPSKEVGGDFYDFFLVDNDHLALVMADVSGKGVPGAMFMMATKIMIKNQISSGKSPAEVLERVNNQLCETNKNDMFVTVWLGIYEISTGTLLASNAGHEYPVWKNGRESFAFFKDQHGFVIGGMEDMQYTNYELQLEPGDTLFIYTDGVLEAIDENANAYGTERLLSLLNRNTSESLEELLYKVKDDVNSFAGTVAQFDDITMLAIRRN
ncbi:MAG: PP2C family protein-serine/threonine phosphatase [Eubacteriales bacterium]